MILQTTPKNFRVVNFTILMNNVEDIDTDRQRITLAMELTASWKDTRISCAKCEANEVRKRIVFR